MKTQMTADQAIALYRTIEALCNQFDKENDAAQNKRQIEIESLLKSAHNIAAREGRDTDWTAFAQSIRDLGIGSVTARTYRADQGTMV